MEMAIRWWDKGQLATALHSVLLSELLCLCILWILCRFTSSKFWDFAADAFPHITQLYYMHVELVNLSLLRVEGCIVGIRIKGGFCFQSSSASKDLYTGVLHQQSPGCLRHLDWETEPWCRENGTEQKKRIHCCWRSVNTPGYSYISFVFAACL